MRNIKVSDYNGSPAILIDGKPYPPMMATIRTNGIDKTHIDEEYYKNLGNSGIKIFFLICDTEWIKENAFSMFTEEAEKLLKAVPDAYIVARIGMHPPVEWCEANPDELMMYSDGKQKEANLFTESFRTKYPAMYSLCSEKWRKDAGEALLKTWDKMKTLPYADRIIGFFFAAGGTSEWYYITPTEYTDKTQYMDTGGFEQFESTGYKDVYADLSPAFRKTFSKYLREKYNTEENLKKAWNDPEASFENPRIPDCAKRYYIDGVDYDLSHPPKITSNSGLPTPPANGTNIGHFIDVEQHKDVYDFFRAWHKGVAESVIYFGNLVKERDPNMLTGAFYGSLGSVKVFSFGQIGSVTDILKSGGIDFLASPGVYENRQPGGFVGQRQVFDSYRLQNRMFVVEEDARTHFENRYVQNYIEMYDMEDSINVLKREFGRNIAYDVQAWWFDQLLGGKRYKHEDIYKLFSEQQKIAKDAYEKDRRKVSEVAIIYDEDSYHLISSESTHQMVELFNNYEIDKIGLPCDRYYKTDFFEEKMPEYKLYIFLNTLCTDEKTRAKIKEKLKKNNATALYMYGSGVVDFDTNEKFSVKNMEELTGIKIKREDGVYRGKFKISKDSHSISDSLDRGEIYGDFTRKMWANAASYMGRIKLSEVNLYPLLYADDPDAINLAYFCDSKKAALTLKETDGYTSIYCGSKYLSCDVIKEIARFSGCHIYSDTDDVLYVGRNYITIHAASSGRKRINLRNKCSLFEVYEKKIYSENSGYVEFDMIKGETKMFEIK